MDKVLKALRNPRGAADVLMQIGLGLWYKGWYKLTKGDRVRVGKNFRVSGRLSIRGPGFVHIGNDVRIGMTVTPWTFAKTATIAIGNGVLLNGTRFACEDSIIIQDRCILADCRIMDTDFHGTNPFDRSAHKVGRIVIEENVWITINCVILKGTQIGSGSTITPNSVVSEDVPRYTLYGGNPGKVMKTLASEPSPPPSSLPLPL